MRGLSSIVEGYIGNYRDRAAKELRYFASRRSLTDAIDVAALAKLPGGRRHPHQRRIPRASLAEARKCLLATDLSSCRNFDDLHEVIRMAVDQIHRIGPLTIYDMALRIGAHLGMEPTSVYLHAGTRVGARALGLGGRQQVLTVAALPRELKRLRPREIEDCLCIYKTGLLRLRNGTPHAWVNKQGCAGARPAPRRSAGCR